MNFRRGLHAIQFSVEQINKTKMSNYVFIIVEVLRCVCSSLLFIFMPTCIVSNLTSGAYQLAFYNILFLCLLIAANECVRSINKAKKTCMEVDVKMNLDEQLAETIMDIPYSQLESRAFQDNVMFGQKCVERNSISLIYQSFIDIVANIITLTGIIFVIVELDQWVFGLIIACVIVNVVGEVFRLNYIYTRERQGNEIEKNLYYARNDLATNRFSKDIRLYHLYDYISNKVTYYASALCSLWNKAAQRSIKIIGWTYVVNGIELIAVYLFLAHATYKNNITLSDFVLFSSATIGLGEALKQILNACVKIITEDRYVQGVFEVKKALDTKGSCNDFPNLLFHSMIAFKDVCFRYPGAKQDTIYKINCCFVKGKKYAIVGKNGSGKTTFIKLLLGLYQPTSGQILIDNQPIEIYSKVQYWKLFSCVFQDYNIFGYSIRENLSFVNQDSAREIASIKLVGLNEKINGLTKQLDTHINPELNKEGVWLSGGQSQQLAIARAIYKEADIYILDEPSAALSPQSEYRLYEVFNEITQNKTAIFISHRLASCQLCDEIIVLDQGHIVAVGTHTDLIQEQGLYAKMYNAQSKPYQNT